eukprot:1156662-Pelagomonas_calceolata.AAC.15
MRWPGHADLILETNLAGAGAQAEPLAARSGPPYPVCPGGKALSQLVCGFWQGTLLCTAASGTQEQPDLVSNQRLALQPLEQVETPNRFRQCMVA